MQKEILSTEIENVIYDLKGIERIFTHLSETEQFKNSKDVYMFLLLKKNIENSRTKLEGMIYEDEDSM